MTGGPCTSPNNNNCGGSSENIGIVDDNNVGCISSHNRNSKSSNGFCNGNQQFCVRWNSHLGSLGAAFPQLLAGQRFVDVTLSVDGHQVLCHRLVLAACSTYFERLLGENPCRHPIIILPSEIHLWEIQAIVDFMYKGEVNISQACLPDLLRCAEILQIRGLCGQDSPLSQMQNNCSPLFTHVNSSTEPEVTALNSPSSSDSPDLLYGVERHESQSHSKPSSPQSQKRLSLNNINIPYMPSICYPVSHRTPSKSPNQPSTSTHPYCNNEDEPIEANMRSTTVYCLKGSDEDNMATTTMHPMVMMDDFNEKNVNGGVANSVVKCEDAYETDSKVNSEYDDDGDNPEKIQAESNKRASYERPQPHHDHHNLTYSHQQSQDCPPSMFFLNHEDSLLQPRTDSMANDDNDHNDDDYHHPNNTLSLQKAHDDNGGTSHLIVHFSQPDESAACNHQQQQLETSAITSTITNSVKNRISNNRTKRFTQNPIKSLNPNHIISKIRVKSNENLFENYENQSLTMPLAASTSRQSLGHSRIKTTATTAESSSTDSLFYEDYNDSRDFDIDYQMAQLNGISKFVDDSGIITIMDDDEPQMLPPSLKFNKDSMSISVKAGGRHCSPPRTKATMTTPKVATTSNASKNTSVQLHKAQRHNFDHSKNSKHGSGIVSSMGYENIICSPNFPTLNYDDDGEVDLDEDLALDSDDASHDGGMHLPPLIPFGANIKNENNSTLSIVSAQSLALPKRTKRQPIMTSAYGGMGGIRGVASGSGSGGGGLDCESAINYDDEQSPCAVILRNPRGNQPRTYTTEALYAALMNVKGGESIYRASQIHKVPRKTLRNWMKRWHIKSAFPMPRQLQQAAEKKKLNKINQSCI